MSFSAASVSAALERQRLIQATRRDIAAKVREDWEWPPVVVPVPPPPPPPKPRKKPQRPRGEGQPHRSDGGAADDEDGEDGEDANTTEAGHEVELRLPLPLLTPPPPTSWACRTLDSSPSPSPNSSPPHSPYRFEHPDAIGPSIAAQERSRRNKRRRLLEEEMRWNEGLRCWVTRRDAWSGAKTLHTEPSDEGDGNEKTNGDNPPVTPPDSPTLIPISAPLHLLHPPPGQLPPVTHPHIYSKIVLKSQTPSVPINLRDLTAALVQGWKDDDMWPPKAAVATTAFVASGSAGVGTARRVAGSSTAATGT
ncbi:MAG: hypothetical protein M1839_009073 [Geoglossum umbratile]|nr:MAG: hypothetical protein M1839_009073 [Geoglossum umbratile]